LPDADPARLLSGATQAAIVTTGPGGCRWATKEGRTGEARAPHVEVVDTTGAGDAFTAALLWQLVAHHGAKVHAEAIAEAVRWATAAGAFACTKEGAIPSLPRIPDVEAIMRRR